MTYYNLRYLVRGRLNEQTVKVVTGRRLKHRMDDEEVKTLDMKIDGDICGFDI